MSETNHLQLDRRRCFYLAVIFLLQIRRLRTDSPYRSRLQAVRITNESGVATDLQLFRYERAAALQ
jgi:hypothetical protein